MLMQVGSMSSSGPEQTFDSYLSTTSVEVVDTHGVRSWHAAKGGRVTQVNSSAVRVSDVQLRAPGASAPVASETWLIAATVGGEIAWELERTYVSSQAASRPCL